ncbi:MAG: acetyl-CoA carboxylase subunit beta [Chlamydiae bacterium RIFCSPHIGHO2_12_FULL_27_8]|nr:MAG: acetyl-CoA carboxylase subunit beta [Chlamydiae bacterium RIFCSPHIGHO2_12_FULL_27_8]OGN65528.1 MAG: acetyl-CoA carboxylase subunit beta [Chlamydiae bacterium RIFCSPLOWO2_01_FULL_28_7]
MGLFSRTKPKIKIENKKSDSFSGWIKCSSCLEMIHVNELNENLNCCSKCNYHYKLSVKERIDLLSDNNSFIELFSNVLSLDPLNFVDIISYKERLENAKEKSKRDEAITTGEALVNNIKISLAVMDFNFMGGSMGSAVGERITLLIEHSIKNKLPLVIVSASGGARMQEGIFSLMQMAKTAFALTKLDEAKLPFISILTNPTTGGVTASFAALGDIIIAEPDALIAFAGPRVVEQTINEKLSKEAQKSEFLLQRGFIDLIVERKHLKEKLTFFLEFFLNNDIKKFSNFFNMDEVGETDD